MSEPKPSFEYDTEKGKLDDHVHTTTNIAQLEDDVPRGKFRKLWDIVQRLDAYGVEARGIERVQPDERIQSSPMPVFWMWLAANLTISTFSLGTLGFSIFQLGLRESVLVILLFNLLTTIPVAYFSTWGPKLGLRQLTISRFSFGYITSLLPVILNCIACIGWSVVNSIVGGQTLRAVSSSHQIPMWAAILVIAIGTIIVSFTGYKFVHLYEKWSWVPVFIIFCIYAGEIGKYVTVGDWDAGGDIEAGICPLVWSYNRWIRLRLEFTSLPITACTFLKIWRAGRFSGGPISAGLNLPLILVESLGAAAMHTFAQKTTWEEAYNTLGVGGLLGVPLTGTMHGFGSFLMVILALSIIANNIPNIYSLSVTFQNIHPFCQAIPRIFVVIIGSVVYIVLAIVGASHFEEWLDTLLVILSYWLAIFITILVEEHLIFRGANWANYEPNDYNNFRKLPLGVASFFALAFGVMGAVLGMAQLWYVGVIGGKIGLPQFGGDIGFELAFAFTAVTFPPLRYLEKRYWGH
ncbi:permease for cytosine/purines, uracil, thiamine, allantoin-domain-containing protein [Flagelloscypha sp. PMI_526]|nr:permease for cytosine/purines, uracil, thiamine, allantoin-domain-containing protein [Flagelloscypha sp. PMI_526]